MLRKILKCKISYADSKLHKVGFSQFCKVNMKCAAAANHPGPLHLVQCVKGKRSTNSSQKKYCSKVKPFHYPIGFEKIENSKNEFYFAQLPLTCHCYKLKKNLN